MGLCYGSPSKVIQFTSIERHIAIDKEEQDGKVLVLITFHDILLSCTDTLSIFNHIEALDKEQ
jgi:hypothetical protein